ncbi:uncharacterized protein LOC103142463 isoform X1 [Poecilia formosa]|uniref:uncharacterized protein LOC103142463 isoform X1 n=1 Tax=Poecilia formosa TaxID=48698 RepID=UPI000443A81B|nr:PREDICTED: uncharacterized protein LOC103142463 isoform X1 [Poecilia formosa]
MTAGFMISRILMLCLIKEVIYASTLPGANTGYTAWQNGGQKQEVLGYRHPLHYVRSLRQPKNNLINTRQNPQRSGVKDLTLGQTFRETPRHLWSQSLPVQPGPQRNYPLVQPRGFRVSLDFPFYKLDQMKETDSPTKTRPKLQSKPNVQPNGLSISDFQSPERDSKKDQNVGKNIHGVPTSTFQVNLTIPLPASSSNPIKAIGKFVENKSPGNIFQNSYGDLGKRLSSIHTEVKPLAISQTAGEQIRKQLGSTWSNYPATGPKQTLQQPGGSTYTPPTNGKLTSSRWQLISPQRNYNPTARQSLPPQKPDSTKPPSLSFAKYLERLGLIKAQTSHTREDVAQPYSKQKLNLSPLQYNRGSQDNKYVGVGSQSVGLPQNGYITSVPANVKDFTSDQKGEKEQDSAVPSLQLEFSFPVKTLSNLTKGGGYLTIRPQNVKSLLTRYMEAKKLQSPGSELKKSVLGFDDAGYHRKTGLPERKWPTLNLELEPKRKQPPPYEPVTVKPTDNKPSFSSWLPRDSETGKPRFPVLAISKYLIDATRPLKGKYQTVRPKPLQSGRLQSFYSSLKPSINSYVESQPRPSASRFASTHDDPLKPYSHLQTNAEIDSGPLHGLLAYGSSSFNYPMLEVVPAKRPQMWQKPISSLYLHEYNSGKEPSYDTFEDVISLHSRLSGYKVQNKLPEQDDPGHFQEGKDYYVKPFDTNGGFVSGQTYQTGNSAETSFNVQPPCESSFSRLGQDGSFSDLRYPYPNAESQPCSQVPCIDGVDECVNEQNANFPQRVSYSPKAEATSISIPYSTFDHIFTQSSYQPAQNGFKLQQYPVGHKQF